MVKKLFNLTLAKKMALSLSLVILMFVSLLVYIYVSYSEVERYHTIRSDFIWNRKVSLLDFHQDFTEFRRVLRATYMSNTWLAAADEVDWERAGYDVYRMYRELQQHSQIYMDLVRGDMLLTSPERMTRLIIVQSVRDNVHFIFNSVLDDEFIHTMIHREENYMAARNEAYFQIGRMTEFIENSLQELRRYNTEANAASIQLIDETVDGIFTVMIIVAAGTVLLAGVFSFFVIKGIQKMAIEKIQEAEEINRKLIEAEPFAVSYWKMEDGEYVIKGCNQSTLDLFGLTDKEEYYRDFYTYSPEYQPCGTLSKEKSEYELAFAAVHDRHRVEWLHVTKYGREFPAEVTYVRQVMHGREYVFSYCVDVSETRDALRKEQEEAVRRMAVEEESRAKTKFLARMSHEIRTPLNAVLGITEIQLLKDTHPQDTEEAFMRIYNSSSLLLKIINDILDLSKVEAGKMEIIPAVYEVASLIVDTVQLNLMHVGSRQITFVLRVDENLHAYLVGDELRIKQILNNIMSNAFKYTPEGTVRLAIFEKETEAGLNLVFHVEDTGVGMSQEQVDSLFNIDFTRFNVASNRDIEGSGLGMNIAHQLVTMMDGTIEVKSKPGSGTAITVTIPQPAEGDKRIGAESAKNLENLEITQREMRKINRLKRETMPYGRVLVVDDVESNLFVAKGLLLPYKLSIELVDSGFAAIDRVKSGEVYDIIFMDHMMPEMDGMEAVRIIRELKYSHPIVALTANTLIGQADLFMRNGFDSFISKPIDITLLNNHLLRFVRDRHPEASKHAEHVDFDETADTSLQSADVFLRDARKALTALKPFAKEQPLDAGAIRTFTVSTHGMKSAFAIMGEEELSQISKELESAGRTILNEIPAYLNRLEAITERLSSETAANADGANADGAKTDGNREHLREQLARIKETCEAFDLEETERLLKALLGKPWPGEIKDILNDISYDLLMGDYDDVIKKADSLIARDE